MEKDTKATNQPDPSRGAQKNDQALSPWTWPSNNQAATAFSSQQNSIHPQTSLPHNSPGAPHGAVAATTTTLTFAPPHNPPGASQGATAFGTAQKTAKRQPSTDISNPKPKTVATFFNSASKRNRAAATYLNNNNNTSNNNSAAYPRMDASDSTPLYSVKASLLLNHGGATNEAAFERLVRTCKATSGLGAFAAKEGFLTPQFSQNEFAKPSNAVFEKFFKSLRDILEKKNEDSADTGMQGDAEVQLVFHGTRPENIRSILGNGLDPKKRQGQAHGAGEYFSRRPNVSLSYCHGGSQMLVFAVVCPKRCLPGATENLTGLGLPASYVVVPTTAHQLPVGVLNFSGASRDAVMYSNNMRAQLKGLHSLLEQKQKVNEEANLKAKIIQLMIKNFLDTAAELFCKNEDKLSDVSKREISMFAHGKYDSDLVFGYFGSALPDPMTVEQFSSETVLNVNATEQDVSSARKMYKDAEAKWKKNNPAPPSIARGLGAH